MPDNKSNDRNGKDDTSDTSSSAVPRPVKKGAVLRLEIDTLAFGGMGVARLDGMAVFVANAVPGDTVSARIVKKKKRYAEARVLSIESPSAYRVDAGCRFCGYCGGCRLRILDYDRQLAYKREQVADALRRIGSIENAAVHPPVPARQTLEYRNKMEFSFSDRRWLLPEEMEDPDAETGFALGLHVSGTFYKVLDIERCDLFPDLGNRILRDVRDYVRQSDRPVYGLRSHEGFWRFLMLRHSVAHDQWMVNIVTAEPDRAAVQPLADRLVERYPQVVSVVNNITARKAGIAVGDEEFLLRGSAVIEDGLGDLRFDISANSFFQTNTRGAETLYQTAAAYADLKGHETVVDLYCGTGTIAIWLSAMSASVVGIEMNESCIADAEKNCRKNNVINVRFLAGDVKDRLAELPRRPDVMVIDPPRAGMHKDVVRQVLALAPERIVYVSCNPATLARDAGMLAEQYTVTEVQPVDMFPHTPHIECVAKLVAGPSASQSAA
ncbi:MAG: 23S rRNA (uracil(1939)-C(5))-methyltransferase RlmD [Thermodesulfobacteriota bacterium]|nr:23S rRNA (uracil(1939)-C(5))-methyltransferase RlmD [Thermodesulfobacteriota bacterium]